jgi:histidinol phosphatase-like enzyme
MAKKPVIANVAATLPFTDEQNGYMMDAFRAVANADDALKMAAEALYEGNIDASMFYTLSSPDEKVMKERKAAFSEQSAAHVRKLACIAKFGEQGYKLMVMHPDLRPKAQNEQFREIKVWVNKAVESLAKLLQGIADSEKDKHGDATKRAANSLLEWLDENLAKIQKTVLVTKKQQDISAADAALEIRALRKRLVELKPAK